MEESDGGLKRDVKSPLRTHSAVPAEHHEINTGGSRLRIKGKPESTRQGQGHGPETGRDLVLDSATAVKPPVPMRSEAGGRTQEICKGDPNACSSTFRSGKIPKLLVGRQRDSEGVVGSMALM